MINISLVNACVIYVHNMARKPEMALARHTFAKKLRGDFLAPWLKERLHVSTFSRSTRTIICELLKLEHNIEPPKQLGTKKVKFVLFARVSCLE
ncbi:hypothetical protein TNCT_537041 [Trichonephila clavata]|uniref:Uncharacterized protein n=1 Tax=Trichonephila clavata TaxID=2740835 RepID=A0A8X6IR65_TRICU|nr:hypothetical protein TNCT_537041 [Trichonephila clavata]